MADDNSPIVVERSTREWKDLIGNAIHKARGGDKTLANKVCDDLHSFEAAGGTLPDSVDKLWEKLTTMLEK